ncbi:MAG: substrate-binding domain-containing protein, partial [Rhodothermales bacterium]
KRDPVTAIFASSDVQAIGAWMAIREEGLSVPEDIALVGYDDIKTSRFIGLSSVDQNTKGVGQEAAERLMMCVETKRKIDRISRLIIPELRIRESSSFTRNA